MSSAAAQTDPLTEAAAFPHGRVPREVRRRQVVALATSLFIERGYQAASMDELGRRAGVSKPVIYELVGSKEELFREVMTLEARELARRVESAVNAEPSHEEKLHAGALAFFGFVSERRAQWSTLMSQEAGPVTAEVAAARRFHAKVVAELLAKGAAELGGPMDPVLTEACAHAINGAFESLATWWQEHPDVDVETLAGLATGLVSPGLIAFARGTGGS